MIKVKSIHLMICVAILFTLFARPSSVDACSCAAGVTVTEEFAQDDAVFTGTVIRIVDHYAPIFAYLDYILSKLGSSPYFFYHFVENDERRLGFSVFFKVIDSWKGVEKTLAEVNTGRGGGDCGYQFVVGEEYLVYANPAYGIPDNYWVTGICTRTAPLSNAKEDLNYLASIPIIPLQFSIPIPWVEEDWIFFLLSLIALGLIIVTRRHIKIRKQTKT